MSRKSKRYGFKLFVASSKTLKKNSSENIEEYFLRLNTVTNEMKRNGESPDNVRVMEKLIRSLTRKFDYVFTSFETSKDLSIISIDEFVGSLQEIYQ